MAVSGETSFAEGLTAGKTLGDGNLGLAMRQKIQVTGLRKLEEIAANQSCASRMWSCKALAAP
jgi:hypothetical protein